MAPPPVVADAEAPHVNFIASHRIPPLKKCQIIRNPTIFNMIRWVDGPTKQSPLPSDDPMFILIDWE